MTEGLKAAYPMADQASWFERIWASVKMVNQPGELVAYWFVVLAFLAITTHHMMMLIEYHLSVMCAAVLIPWGLWSATASVGEFAVGWLTGGFIRALVSTAMLGIALPLFGLLNRPAEGFITLYNTVMLIGGAFIFAVLAWVIPARAAGIASRGMSLAIHGGTVTAAAMTFARFGMMAQGAGAAATRAHSRMMAARQMAAQGHNQQGGSVAEDHTWQEYANQDNVDDAYQDMQEGLFDDQDEPTRNRRSMTGWPARFCVEMATPSGASGGRTGLAARWHWPCCCRPPCWPGPSITSGGSTPSCKWSSMTRKGAW